jgi:O-antigen/teichoic acid export membrane protein
MSTEQQAVYGVREVQPTEQRRLTQNSISDLLTKDRIRIWGSRVAFSLLDQGFTSGASFVVNLLMARWMLAEVYGAFAVAFAGFLFVSGFHNVLLLEPMSVFGPSRHSANLRPYFRAQLTIHGLTVGVLALLALAGSGVVRMVSPGSPLVGALAGSGLALPFLLLQWQARRICYVVQRPSTALCGSACYLAFVLAGVFALGRAGLLGAFSAFAVMGFGSLVASLLLLWRVSGHVSELDTEKGIRWYEVLRENWTYGRWLVGSTVLSSVSSQTQMFLVAGLLGLGAAGILRATQVPSLVMMQVIAAAGWLFLPALSYDFGHGRVGQLRRKAGLVSFALTGLSVAFVALLAMFSSGVEHILFAGRYAGNAHLMPLLGLATVCMGFWAGYSLGLRALQKPQFELLSNAIAAPIGLVTAVCFIHWWGIEGAAASLVTGFCAQSATTFIFFRRATDKVSKLQVAKEFSPFSGLDVPS